MVPCTLTWTTINPTRCPACLEVLTDDSIVFCDGLAFCPLCALPSCDDLRDACVRVFFATLSPDCYATYRGLNFFTPNRCPGVPLQLVRPGCADDWLLDPLADCFQGTLPFPETKATPVVDDNPGLGRPPIQTLCRRAACPPPETPPA